MTTVPTPSPAEPAPAQHAPAGRDVAVFGPVPHTPGARRVRYRRPGAAAARAQDVHLSARPQCIEFDIVRSVLVVIDMQNDFCHDRGWFAKKGIDVQPMRRPVMTAWMPPAVTS